jgi:uncharacterized protein YndB with AHSA1/START domain
MTTLERTVTTPAPPDRVFPYLVDFRNAEEWDSGTRSCELVSGDGGVGSVYHNVSTFVGSTVELDYTVEEVAEPRFVIVGRNETTTSHDTITLTPTADGGTEVRYLAEFTFTGLVRFAGPVMKPLLERLGDATAAQLKAALDRL